MDLEERSLEVCFGSPAVNGWQRFGFEVEPQPGFYPAKLPQERAGVGFWEMVEMEERGRW